MDNTMYYVEFGFAKGLGLFLSYNNDFVGNSFQLLFLCFFVNINIPRKSRHEDTAYPWKFFKLIK